MDIERKKLLYSLVFPSLFVAVIWLIKLAEIIFHFDLGFLGVYPLHLKGLPGIILSPLIHRDIPHLAANTLPFLVLAFGIFYFYRPIAYQAFFMIYLLAGIWLWFGGRESYHIGASGVIYGMASFLFISGLIRRDARLMALSLLVIFLYGSLVWGVFPDFFPEREISWEGHLMGLVAGLVVAIYYRKHGPQRKKYEWEYEEEEDEEENNDEHVDTPGYKISYHYKKNIENRY